MEPNSWLAPVFPLPCVQTYHVGPTSTCHSKSLTSSPAHLYPRIPKSNHKTTPPNPGSTKRPVNYLPYYPPPPNHTVVPIVLYKLFYLFVSNQKSNLRPITLTICRLSVFRSTLLQHHDSHYNAFPPSYIIYNNEKKDNYLSNTLFRMIKIGYDLNNNSVDFFFLIFYSFFSKLIYAMEDNIFVQQKIKIKMVSHLLCNDFSRLYGWILESFKCFESCTIQAKFIILKTCMRGKSHPKVIPKPPNMHWLQPSLNAAPILRRYRRNSSVKSGELNLQNCP